MKQSICHKWLHLLTVCTVNITLYDISSCYTENTFRCIKTED